MSAVQSEQWEVPVGFPGVFRSEETRIALGVWDRLTEPVEASLEELNSGLRDFRSW